MKLHQKKMLNEYLQFTVETIDNDKRLKVKMENHHILEDIFNGTYTIN